MGSKQTRAAAILLRGLTIRRRRGRTHRRVLIRLRQVAITLHRAATTPRHQAAAVIRHRAAEILVEAAEAAATPPLATVPVVEVRPTVAALLTVALNKRPLQAAKKIRPTFEALESGPFSLVYN